MRLVAGLLCVGLLIGIGSAAGAQGAGEAKPDPGYAIGHVTCADTQRPARVAQVRFVPMPTAAPGNTRQKEADVKMADMRNAQELGTGVNPVETDMDGNFSVRNLKPGRYVVRVDLGGYLTPLMSFTESELRQPDVATRDRIARELQMVDIHSRAETRVDVSLQRGATISGTVRFDDGSPAIGLGTQLLQKDTEGKWQQAPLSGLRFGSTDASGRYQIEAVPPGSYLVRANLSLNEHSYAVMPMPTTGNEMHVEMTTTIFSLPVFTGSALREREATPIKVEGAALYDGNDISLPISKLHQVSGTVVGDGHALNGGKIVLRYPDDNSEVASVEVSRDERQFRFPYVPEGSYTLSVEDARDVTEVEVPNPSGVSPKTRMEDKTVRRYGKVEQPLVVQTDVEGVLATVPEAKGPSPAGAGQANE